MSNWLVTKTEKRFWIFVDVMKHAGIAWQNDNASRLAASLAFYTIFSLAPVLLIGVGIAGAIVGSETARQALIAELGRFIGNEGAAFVLGTLDQARASMTGRTATLIGLSASLFGATVMFAELQSSLNQVWNIRNKKGFNWKHLIYVRLLSFSMVLLVGLFLLGSVILSTAVSAIHAFFSAKIAVPSWLLPAGYFSVSFFMLTLAFGVLFKVLPDVRISWRDVAMGAIFTSLLFTIGKMLIGLYLAESSLRSLYGAAGSFVIILAWVYYSSQVFFFGAELCQVWSSRYGSGIVPSRHGELDLCALERLKESIQDEPSA